MTPQLAEAVKICKEHGYDVVKLEQLEVDHTMNFFVRQQLRDAGDLEVVEKGIRESMVHQMVPAMIEKKAVVFSTFHSQYLDQYRTKARLNVIVSRL